MDCIDRLFRLASAAHVSRGSSSRNALVSIAWMGHIHSINFTDVAGRIKELNLNRKRVYPASRFASVTEIRIGSAEGALLPPRSLYQIARRNGRLVSIKRSQARCNLVSETRFPKGQWIGKAQVRRLSEAYGVR